MSPTENFVAYVTLRLLLLDSTVRRVGLAQRNDQYALLGSPQSRPSPSPNPTRESGRRHGRPLGMSRREWGGRRPYPEAGTGEEGGRQARGRRRPAAGPAVARVEAGGRPAPVGGRTALAAATRERDTGEPPSRERGGGSAGLPQRAG